MRPEQEIIDLLRRKKYRIAFAESCTGGMCVSRLVGEKNASYVLSASVVTYSEESKIKYAGVRRETLDQFGVVSEEVAGEMAEGIAKQTKAEVGVSTTGFADSRIIDEIPEGLVCFGFYVRGSLETKTLRFPNMTRNEVRTAAADFVFTRLLELLT